MSLEEMKNYLIICGFKVNSRKKELVSRVFAAGKNSVKSIKIAF